jgi:hypothetical protein
VRKCGTAQGRDAVSGCKRQRDCQIGEVNMSNYVLARLIVDDIMKKINSGEQVFYQEYVRATETLIDKHTNKADSLEAKFYKLVTPEGKQNYIIDGHIKMMLLLCQSVDKLTAQIKRTENR